MSDLRQSSRIRKPTYVEARQSATNRRSKNNAPATALDASSPSVLEHFHRDAVWRGNRLIFRRRVVATVVRDRQWPSMWRARLPSGRVSDLANLSRAKDAAQTLAYQDAVSQTLPKRR
jgi:hypothetical protein